MKKLLALLLLSLFFISFISAIWYNPLTWFSSNNDVEINQPRFSVQNLGQDWVIEQALGDYDVYFLDKNKQKTTISFCNRVTTRKQDLPNEMPIYDLDGNKITQLNLKQNGGIKGNQLCYERVVDNELAIKLNPTVVYQNISQVSFNDRDLQVNQTYLKYNGETFVLSQENIWISVKDNSTFKSGANDTISKIDTRYQTLYKSNKEIKYDEKSDYYYFDEYYADGTQLVKNYKRSRLTLTDICANKIRLNKTTNLTYVQYPECSYDLNNYYYTITENNETFEILNYSELVINFTGFYDEVLDMVFIDPTISYTTVTTANSIVKNVSTEVEFSHLTTNDSGMKLYMPFDINSRDLTTNNKDGTLVNQAFINTTDGAGKWGGALVLDGDGDYVTAGDIDATQFTVSAWVKTEENTTQYVVGKGTVAGYEYGLVVNGTAAALRIWECGGTTYSDSDWSTLPISTGEWHMVTGVYQTTPYISTRIYIDGVYSQGGSVNSGTRCNSANGVYIGRRQDLTTVYFNGSIDEVMIFNRALGTADPLTSVEIMGLYNATRPRFYPEGNQTFQFNSITLGTDNKINLTAKAQTLNGSIIICKIYSTNSTY